MGYIAYAASTLIVAIVIRTIYNRTSDTKQHDSLSPNLDRKRKEEVVPSHPVHDELRESSLPVPASPITIEISHDETSSSTSSERDDSPPQSHRRRELTPEKNGAPTSPTSTPVSRVQSREMPPPPRPSSTPNLQALSAAAQSRSAVGTFPASSLTASRNRSPPRLKPATTSSLAPQVRRPGGFNQAIGLAGSSSLAPPPSAASTARSRPIPSSNSLGVPQQKVLANTRMQPQAPSTSTQPPAKRASRKVILSPGHSPLDWAALHNARSDEAVTTLRGENASQVLGPYRLGRITPSQLRRQTGRKGKDAWTSYQGKVYNISAYLDFHPGGKDELIKGAGRSSDNLFAEVHPWVNWEGMLSNCMIGMLVAEDDPGAIGREQEGKNELDEMD